MTALVDRLEQAEAAASPGPWLDSAWWDARGIKPADAALIVELRNALPALLTALRAARAMQFADSALVAAEYETPSEVPRAQREYSRAMRDLDAALSPLFGEDTTP